MATTTIAADQVSYGDLYRRWEQGNWSATAIDLSTDREQWENTFSDLERRSARWLYTLFFHGEDSVADNLSPFIDAAPRNRVQTCEGAPPGPGSAPVASSSG